MLISLLLLCCATKIFEILNCCDVIDAYSFRVYFKGSAGPVLLLLHGGGHSALSWAVFAVSLTGWTVVLGLGVIYCLGLLRSNPRFRVVWALVRTFTALQSSLGGWSEPSPHFRIVWVLVRTFTDPLRG